MIFLGDIVRPFATPPDWSALCRIGAKQPMVVNLEGAISDRMELLAEKRLYNRPAVLDALDLLQTRVVCPANNHITDIYDGISNTPAALEGRGMQPVGASDSPEESNTARVFCAMASETMCFLHSAGLRSSASQSGPADLVCTHSNQARCYRP